MSDAPTLPIAFDFAAISAGLRELIGEDTEEYCAACENGGWVCFCIGVGDPHFRSCPVCYNPGGHPCP